MRDPGLVAVVAYDGLCTFEFGIAVEIFGLSRPEFSFPWYRFAVVGADRGPLRATGGIKVVAKTNLGTLARARTIVIPGWRDRGAPPPAALLSALRKAHRRGARLVSICSGVFVLAATGLLDGRRATTHWRYAEELAARYPKITVDPDVLYVDDGNVLTSAGSAAGIDACLYLVARDFGWRVANTIARRLVMTPHRAGGQAQFIRTPLPDGSGSAVAEVMDWARRNLSRSLRIGDLARRAAMSERTFLRRFEDAAGTTPKTWLQHERIGRAQDLLETSDRPLDRVAESCGYQSPETFRAVFRARVGISPAAYRRQFRTGSPKRSRISG
ncbi:MAG TPA: transcriptional regulator FtrA [Thermoanaerobaculia bacterium]